METGHDSQFVVLAKGNWTMKTSYGHTFRNNDIKGTVDIQFYKLSGQSLVSKETFFKIKFVFFEIIL